MDEVKRAVWDKIKGDLYITEDQYLESVKDWTFDPVYHDGKLAVVFLVLGPKFHYMTFGAGYSVNREMLRKYPGSLVDKYGYAETFTPIDDKRQHRFNEKIGFKETHRDAANVYFRIEQLRKSLCQS